MSNQIKIQEDWVELALKISFVRQLSTKYLEQNKKLQWNSTGQEKFDIYFCFFVDCYGQNLISGKET